MFQISKRLKGIAMLAFFSIGFTNAGAQSIGEQPAYVTTLRTFGHGMIDSVWKYKEGDVTEGEAVDLDDAAWQPVNTENLTGTTGKPVSWKGTGWFRNWVDIPDSVRGKTIALMMGHMGVSEIFLDGKLIRKFGELEPGAESEKPVFPREVFFVQLDSQSRHLFAVHFSSHLNNSLISNLIAFPGFRLLATTPDKPDLQSKKPYPLRVISASFYIAFFLFFCFVYGFYPGRLSGLMSALVLANFSIIFITILIGETSSDGALVLGAVKWWKAALSLAGGLSLLFYYAAYYGKLIQRTWIIIVFMLINFVCITFLFSDNIKILLTESTIIGWLFTIESFRIIILGIRNKKSGFQILLIGGILGQLGLNLVIFNMYHLFPPYPTTLHSVLAILTDLNTPLVLALYLAWEFGSTNRDLRKQMAQVNKLSLESIQQEQEKQQMLSSQNELLERQVKERTGELTEQRNELQVTLENLKSTQSLLIQSEKMASLGELTAGIAHEIQNPLNFVNNFSEVNGELIRELQDEIALGNFTEVQSIANDILENEKKISHHGKRADSIVKGMLQHSSSTSGNREKTDINALADEYLRLAYHGLRAKDKSFNALLKTDYDPSAGYIAIVPQDIGRVLLNLYNNAFYAISEKRKAIPSGENYEPTVLVETRRIKDNLEIRIADNGNGIPHKILNKIFQPFFTTKPTGQGTGLGLSLSYDIIRAHGGELKVETKENEGSEFTILI